MKLLAILLSFFFLSSFANAELINIDLAGEPTLVEADFSIEDDSAILFLPSGQAVIAKNKKAESSSMEKSASTRVGFFHRR